MRITRRTALAGAALLAAPAVRAQAFPDKPLRMVIPFAPGGTTDNHGRLLSAKMTDILGQQVIPDNKPGAGSTVGAEVVARAPADGYTILFGSIATHALAPHLYPKLPYDPFGDFIPVALVGTQPNMLCCNVNFPHDTIPKLVAAAKAEPGKYIYGSSGTGTSPTLSIELFKQKAGVNIVLAPYKGAAPASNDAIAGHIQMVVSNIDSVKALVDGGKLKAIAVSGPERSPMMPNVPTIAEAGYPDVKVESWSMTFVPKGTPAAVVERLRAATQQALDSKEVGDRLRAGGFTPGRMPAAELDAFVRGENKRWGDVIRGANIKAEG